MEPGFSPENSVVAEFDPSLAGYDILPAAVQREIDPFRRRTVPRKLPTASRSGLRNFRMVIHQQALRKQVMACVTMFLGLGMFQAR